MELRATARSLFAGFALPLRPFREAKFLPESKPKSLFEALRSKRFVRRMGVGLVLVMGSTFAALQAVSVDTGSSSTVDNYLLLNSGVTNQYAEHPSAGYMGNQANATFEAWIFPTNNTASKQTLFAQADSFHIFLRNGKLWSAFFSGTWREQESKVAPALNEWSHVAFVKRGTDVLYYLNGYLAETIAVNAYSLINPTLNRVRIGLNPSSSEHFSGRIDEVRIWVISRENLIQSAMHSRVPTNSPGLVGYWDFNEPSGSIAYDRNNAGIITQNLDLFNSPTRLDVKSVTSVSGGDTVVTFPRTYLPTGAAGWTVPANAGNVRTLVVGGGGSSTRGVYGAYYGGGGGGGEVLTPTPSLTANSLQTVQVGMGGLGTREASSAPGNSGQSSIFGSVATARGGSPYPNTMFGGSSGNGNLGGNSGADGDQDCADDGCAAGGGGGAGGAGGPNGAATGMNAGPGVLSSITGSSLMYGSGGVGLRSVGGLQVGVGQSGGATRTATTFTDALANRGGGGADATNVTTTAGFPGGGSNGGSGVVVVRYTPTADLAVDLAGNANSVLTGPTGVIPSGAFTVESWVYLRSNASQTIFSEGLGSPDSTIYLTTQANGQFYVRWGAAESSSEVVGLAPIDRWAHVALTRDANGLPSLLVDGVLVWSSARGSSLAPNSSGPFRVGIQVGNGATLNGQIDQVKVWNVALTASELALSMHSYAAAQANGSVVTSQAGATLRAHYDFNEATDTRIEPDRSGNNRDLTYGSAIGPTSYKENLIIERGTAFSSLQNFVKFNRSYLTAAGGWTAPSTMTRYKALVVAGGGGGGGGPSHVGNNHHMNGGGGGAGGLLEADAQASSGGAIIPVRVGQGGSGTIQGTFNANTASASIKGGDSAFGAMVAVGGGAGGFMPSAGNITAATTGGSGGGGGAQAVAGSDVSGRTGTSGQGNRGGDGFTWNGSFQGAGGGGGAGGAGVAANSSTTSSGAGGAGAPSSITGSRIMYAGGGGGGSRSNTPGAAGSGVGGAGGVSAAGSNAAANLGGGGGGGSSSGGSGGSGVVILSYGATMDITQTPGGARAGSTFQRPILVQLKNSDNTNYSAAAANQQVTLTAASGSILQQTIGGVTTNITSTTTTSRGGVATFANIGFQSGVSGAQSLTVTADAFVGTSLSVTPTFVATAVTVTNSGTTAGQFIDGVFQATAASATNILVSDLVSAMTARNVTIESSGNISVSTGLTSSSTYNLSLSCSGSGAFANSSGAISLAADLTVSCATVTTSATITTSGTGGVSLTSLTGAMSVGAAISSATDLLIESASTSALNANLQAGSQGILVKSAGRITGSAGSNAGTPRLLGTSGGPITLWTTGTTGGVTLGNFTQLNTTQTGSAGADITIGGGSAQTADASRPSGAASSSAEHGVQLGTTVNSSVFVVRAGTGAFSTSGTYTGTASTAKAGIWLPPGQDINAGTIELTGTTTYNQANDTTTSIDSYFSGSSATSLIHATKSFESSGDAIRITGSSASNTGMSLGPNIDNPSPMTIRASGNNAGISITGTSSSATASSGLWMAGVQLQTANGPVLLNSGTRPIALTYTNRTSSYSPVAGSTGGHVRIVAGGLHTGSSAFNVSTAGDLTFEPSSSSFGSAVTFPTTGSTTSVGNLIVGGSNNTANLTVGAAVTSASEVTYRGGSIDVSGNVTSTNGTAAFYSTGASKAFTKTTSTITAAQSVIISSAASTVSTGTGAISAATVRLSSSSTMTSGAPITSRGTVEISSSAGNTTVSGGVNSAGDLSIVGGDVAVNAAQTTTNSRNITISPRAAYTGSGTLNSSGTITISGGSSVGPTNSIQATGNISVSGSGNFTNSGASITSSLGNVSISTSGVATAVVSANVQATTGSIAFNTGGAYSGAGTLTAGTTVAVTSAGVTVTGAVLAGGNVTYTSTGSLVQNANVTSSTGNVTMSISGASATYTKGTSNLSAAQEVSITSVASTVNTTGTGTISAGTVRLISSTGMTSAAAITSRGIVEIRNTTNTATVSAATNAAGNLTISSPTVIVSATQTTTNSGNITITPNGGAYSGTGQLTSAGSITIEGGTTVDPTPTGAIQAVSNIVLRGSGQITTGTSTTLNSTAGSVEVRTTGGLVTLGNAVLASGSITVALTAAYSGAGSLTATNGTVTISGGTSVAPTGAVRANGDITLSGSQAVSNSGATITSTAGAVSVRSTALTVNMSAAISASTSVTLRANAALDTSAAITSSTSRVSITSDTSSINLGSPISGREIDIAPKTTYVGAGSLTASAGTIRIMGGSSVQPTGAIRATGNITLSGTGAFTNITNASITSTGGDVDITASASTITLTKSVSATNVRLESSGALGTGTDAITASQDISLTSTGSTVTTSSGTLSVARNFTLSSSGLGTVGGPLITGGTVSLSSSAGGLSVSGAVSATSTFTATCNAGQFANTSAGTLSASAVTVECGSVATSGAITAPAVAITATSSTGDLSVGANITVSGLANELILKSKRSVINSATATIRTNNAALVFWADSDGNSTGVNRTHAGSVFNTVNGSTSDTATGGGDMIFAGGASTDVNGYPTGYAFSDGTDSGFHSGSGTCATTSYYTGGGKFIARAQSTGSFDAISVNCSIRLWANAGQIEFDGRNTSSGAAIQLQRGASSTQSEIFSSSNSSPAIKFTALSGTGVGFFSGYNLATAHRIMIQNTGTGGVTIIGDGGAQDSFDVGLNSTNILSRGPISITGQGTGWNGGLFTQALYNATSGTSSTLGYCSAATCTGSRVTSSSANISITANRFTSWNNDVNLAINTSGTFTFAPSDAAGFSEFKLGGQGFSVSADCSGVTFGKDQTSNVYTANNIDIYANIKIAGPIRIYAHHLNIRSSLETTGGASSEIRLKMVGRMYLEASKSLKTAGGDVVIWTGTNKVAGTNLGNSTIYLESSTAITTNGGKIWLGGGLDDGGADAQITSSRGKWSSVAAGDGFPDGYAVGHNDNNEWRIGIFLNTGAQLKSGGGDIFMAGAHGIAAYGDYGHMVFYPGTVVDSGAGRIAMWARSLTAITTQGIAFHWGNGGDPTIITSNAPSADAITIYSDSSLGSSWSRGITALWHANESVTRGWQGTQILATASGGGISMTGIGSATATNDANGMYLDFVDILSVDGPVTLNGDSNDNNLAAGVTFGWVNNGASSIRLGGWHRGPTNAVGGGTITTPGGVTANFTNSSADVTINTDSMITREDSNSFHGVIFGTTGDVSILPANRSSGLVAATDNFEHAHNATNFQFSKLLFPVTPGSMTLGRANTQTALTPGSALSATGTVSVTGGTLTMNQTTSGGTVRLKSTTGATTVSAAATSGVGGTTIDSAAALAVNANSTSAGNLTFNPVGAYTGSGSLTASGSIGISGGTSVAPTGALQASGDVVLSGSGDITTTSGSSANITSSSGAVSVSSTSSTVSLARNVTAATSVLVTANSVDLQAILSATSSSGVVTIAPQSNDRVIDLGTEVSGRLSLTSAEVNRVSAGTLRIGALNGTNTGNIDITAALSPSLTPTLALRTGGSISSSTTRSITETNLGVQAGGTISLAASNVISGNLALNSPAATLTFNQTSGSFTPGTVDGISPEYGVPSSLTLSRVPNTATENRTLGQDFDPSPVATLRDEFGNSLTAANSQASNYSVTVTRATGSGAVSGTLIRSATAGVATFDNLRIITTPGAHTLTFAATSAGVSAAIIGSPSATTGTYNVRGTQTITFSQMVNRTLGASNTFSVTATTERGLTVAFTSDTSSVCTVSDTTVSMVTAGTCRINANQAGDASNSPAPQVQREFVISSALVLTTPASGLTGTFNSAYTLTISRTGGASPHTFAVASGTLPSGLSIESSTGVIRGTPSTASTQTVTVRVTDANGAIATTNAFTLTVSRETLATPTAPTVAASTTSLKRLDVSWSAVSNASSYVVKLYDSTGSGSALATVSVTSGTSRTLTTSDYASFADLTVYTVSVQAIGLSNYQDSLESAKTSGRTRGLPQSITVDTSGVVDATGAWIDGTWYTATLGTSRVTPTSLQTQMSSANATLQTAGAITVSNTVQSTSAPQSLTLNSTAGNITVTGAVSVAGNISISGAEIALNANLTTTNGGNVTISPTNSYSGSGVLNSAGTLSISGGTSVAPTGALQASGNILISGSGNITTSSTADISSTAGSVSITSTGASLTLDRSVSAASAISLTANRISLGATIGTTSSSGVVTIAPQFVSRVVNLGAEDLDHLSLTSSELNRVSAGTLRIGALNGSNSGNINVTAAIAPTGVQTLALRTSGSVESSGSGSITEVNLAISASYINLGGNNSITGNLALSSSGATLTYNQISGSFTPTTVDQVTPEYGIATQILMSQVPVSTPVDAMMNEAFNPPPLATLKDKFDNELTTANSQSTSYTVTAAKASGTGVLIGTKSTTTSTRGVARFDNLGFDASGVHTITFTATVTATSAQITGTPSFTTGSYNIQASQTISFTSTAPGSARASGATYTPLATSTSSLTVSITVDASSSSVCSISAGTVSFLAAGTCVLNANQSGNSSFAAATQVQQSFAVASAQLDTPTAPTVAATANTLKSLDVSWTAVENAASYTVKVYAAATGSESAIVVGISGTSTTIRTNEFSQIADSTMYYVSVTAVASSSERNSAESLKGTGTTNSPAATPTISFQPTGVNKTVGQSATFSVGATKSDNGVLSYQWRKDGNNISGATSSTLTRNPAAESDTGSYSVVVTNSLNGTTASTTSNAVSFTVSPTLTITTPTTGLSATVNSAYSLSVTATGGRASLSFSTSSTLPTGITLSSGGVLSGTPTQSGTFALAVTVTDLNSATATSSSFNLIVASAPGLVPTFATPVSAISGSTDRLSVQITNFDANYTYAGTSSIGSVSVNSSGLVVFSGVSSGQTAVATITTNRDHYLAASASVSATLTPIPVISYNASDLNSFSTSTSVRDLSGRGNHATRTATVANSFDIDGASGAWKFPGGNPVASFIDLPDLTTNTFSSGITIDFEADFGAIDSFERIFTLSRGGDPNQVLIQRSGIANTIEARVFSANNSNSSSCSASIPAGLNRWTISLSSSSCVIMRDGITVGSGSVSFFFGPDLTWTSNFIGRNTGTSGAFEGQIRSFRIYAGTPSYSQIGAVSYKTLTYNSDGGSTVTSTTRRTTSGDLLIADAITRTGYRFLGWYDSTNTLTRTKIGDAGVRYTPSSDISLFAGWDANELAVTFNSNSGTLVTSTTTRTGEQLVEPTPPTRTGYTFAGWFPDNSLTGTAISFPYAHVETANFTLYAKWTANPFTVTFVSNSGTSVTDFTTRTAEALPNSFTTTRAGYNFDGWFTDSGFTGSAISFPYTHGQTANFTLYAKWTAKNLTVSFNVNGGSAVTSATTRTAEAFSSTATSTRAGYTFDGWFASSTLTGSRITFPHTHGQTDNFTLYAKWEANTLTVTFEPNGGTAVTSTTVRTDEQITSAPVDPTRAGYTFAGWHDTFEMTDPALTFPHTHGRTADIFLYAKWAPNINTVTFDANFSGGSTRTQSITTGVSTALTANVFTRTGYTFDGWSRNDDGTGTNYTNLEVVGVTSSFTLYAKWSANTLNVTFNTNSGSAITTATTRTGLQFSSTATTTRAGYTFLGWFDNEALTGSAISFPYTHGRTANFTLYAKWDANTLDVSFNTNSGTAVTATTTRTAGVLPNTFTTTRAGYTFMGWFDNDALAGSAISFPYTHAKTANFTLYAKWDANTLNVSFNTNSGSAVTATTTRTAAALPNTFTTTRAGYTFLGWFDNAEFSGSAISFPYTHGKTSDFTLFAKWDANTLNVSFNTNSGTAVTATTARTGEQIPTSFTTTRAGYSFVGWFDNEALTGSAISFPYTHGKTANFTLFAKWDANTLNVSFNSNSGSAVTATTTRTAAALPTTFTTTRAGYTFLGWFDNEGFAGSAIAFPYAHGKTSDFTLFAKWGANTLNVSFNANSGTAVTATTTRTAEVLPTTVTTTRAGYTFMGWFDNAELSGSAISFPYTHGKTADFTLYAKWDANVLNVTLDTNSGSGVTATTTRTAASLPTTFTTTRAGYAFAGWFDNPSFTGSAISFPYTHGKTSDFTIYAKWDANTLNVNFITNSGTAVTAVTTRTGLQIPTSFTTTRSGHTFLGWFDNAEFTGSAISFPYAHTKTADFTLFAKWDANSLTVSFDSNGGSSVTSTSTRTGEQILSAPIDPTRAGYTFAGWFDNNLLFGSRVAFPYTHGQTASFTLYAKWDANTLNVSFESNSGSAVTATTTRTAEQILAAPTAPTKTGYTFDGWYEAADLTGSQVGFPYAHTKTADFTLYAKWNANVLNVSFNSNGGTAVTAVTTRTGEAITSAPVAPTRAGYDFVAWYENSDLSGTAVSFPFAHTKTESFTLNAKWEAKTLTVSFNSGGGSAVSSMTTRTAESMASAPPNPTRAGYNFLGWVASEDLSGSVVLFPYIHGKTGDFILYAKWDANTLNVSFDANGGVAVTATTVRTDGQIAATITTTRAGYAFVGWFDNAELTGSVVTFPYTHGKTANFTLFAKWNANTLNVTFDTNSGTAVTATTTRTGVQLAASVTTTRAGYTFAGWFDNVGLTGSQVSFPFTHGQTANFTLYAKWTPNTLNVRFELNDGTSGFRTATTTTGSEVAAPATNPTHPGFEFMGWSATEGGSALSFPHLHGRTTDFTLHAVWKAGNYTVLYQYNGATGGNSVTSQGYTTDIARTGIVLPVPTRTAYSFTGWRSDISLATPLELKPNGRFVPIVNQTVYAEWTPIDYTVTYNAGLSADSGTVPVDSRLYNIGQTVSLLSNSGLLGRTGYNFAGWLTSPSSSDAGLNSGQTVTVESTNINFYPKWTAKTYSISYNLNGGSGSLTGAPVSWTVGTSNVTLPSSGFTRTGYDFGGWARTAGGSAVSNSFSNNFVDENLTAIWTLKNISYTFTPGAASSSGITRWPANASGNFGSEITLPDLDGEIVTIGGNQYLFFGWGDGSATFRSGQKFVLTETLPQFTAQWVKLLDVRYSFAGGTKSVSDTETNDGDLECVNAGLCAPNQEITLRGAPTRLGYSFAGWKTQDTSATVLREAGTKTVIRDDNYLFFAEWTPIDYNFSFNSLGGSINNANLTGNIGRVLTMPSAGTRTGYTFSGWSSDAGVNKYAAGPTYVIGSASIGFEATWVPDVYQIAYDWQGGIGSPEPSSSFTVGRGPMTLPGQGDRVKDGYNFAGWSTTLGGAVVSNYEPTANGVLFAKWDDGNYTVSFNAQNGPTPVTDVLVQRTTSTILRTPTRPNFRLIGWFDALTGGNFVGNAGDPYLPTASKTLYARWVQSSFFGVDEAALETATTYTASSGSGIDTTITHNPSGSRARIQIPAGTLPNGTVVSVRYFKDVTRQRSVIGETNNYFFSVLVSWLLGTGATATVPDTLSDANGQKPITVTLSNTQIKAGAMVYQVIDGVVTPLQRATVDGSITVLIYSDPELVVAATPPTAPQNVLIVGPNRGSSTVSWLAPQSTGGSPVMNYNVYLDGVLACSAITVLSCDLTNLSDSNTYNVRVVANNAVGSGEEATTSFTTQAPPSSSSGGGSTPGPVVPVKPVDPALPLVPVKPAPVQPIAPAPVLPVDPAAPAPVAPVEPVAPAEPKPETNASGEQTSLFDWSWLLWLLALVGGTGGGYFLLARFLKRRSRQDEGFSYPSPIAESTQAKDS